MWAGLREQEGSRWIVRAAWQCCCLSVAMETLVLVSVERAAQGAVGSGRILRASESGRQAAS